ncbi:Aquaporin NIP1-2 [Abeliophyllum distichum]|uniref:Aquaporin NIP1-2 n=1 Tax=Abeliophyllum distichum TaxID=126358 RepID=A0ABD1UHT3_9LAMI
MDDDISRVNSNRIVSINIEDDDFNQNPPPPTSTINAKYSSGCSISVSFVQKLIAEFIGTYFLIFGGCTAVIVNKNMDNVVTLPGIAAVWGLVVVVMIYSVGHISGAHLNPAVTAYIVAQVLASIVASGTLRLLFIGNQDHFIGTLPSGSVVQSFIIEFITTFYLMFVISGVATDNRAVSSSSPYPLYFG